jgi:hypothetical protein
MRRQRDDDRRAYPVHRVDGRAGHRAITAEAPAPVRCVSMPDRIQVEALRYAAIIQSSSRRRSPRGAR